MQRHRALHPMQPRSCAQMECTLRVLRVICKMLRSPRVHVHVYWCVQVCVICLRDAYGICMCVDSVSEYIGTTRICGDGHRFVRINALCFVSACGLWNVETCILCVTHVTHILAVPSLRLLESEAFASHRIVRIKTATTPNAHSRKIHNTTHSHPPHSISPKTPLPKNALPMPR